MQTTLLAYPSTPDDNITWSPRKRTAVTECVTDSLGQTCLHLDHPTARGDLDRPTARGDRYWATRSGE